jgi:hypothetical protein
MLSKLFPLPNKGANQTSSPEKAHESMANEKNPPHWTTPQSLSFLSPFEIMYGRPFLLGNFLPTEPAPLADDLPSPNLLRKLLSEHVD